MLLALEGLTVPSAPSSRLPDRWWKRRCSKFRPLGAPRSATPAFPAPSRHLPAPALPAGLPARLMLGARGSPTTRLRSPPEAGSLCRVWLPGHLVVATCLGLRGILGAKSAGFRESRGGAAAAAHLEGQATGEPACGTRGATGEWGRGRGRGRKLAVAGGMHCPRLGPGQGSGSTRANGGPRVVAAGFRGCAKIRALSLGSVRAAGGNASGASRR